MHLRESDAVEYIGNIFMKGSMRKHKQEDNKRNVILQVNMTSSTSTTTTTKTVTK